MNPDIDCLDYGPTVPARLRDAWEHYYLSRGVSRFKATGLARAKALKGKTPPAQ